MANNGYLVGLTCTGDVFQKTITLCPSGTTYLIHGYYKSSGLQNAACYNSAFVNLGNVPNASFDCEILGPPPPSTIPTVADGITLGWQAGAALILVGCILFLKKALK